MNRNSYMYIVFEELCVPIWDFAVYQFYWILYASQSKTVLSTVKSPMDADNSYCCNAVSSPNFRSRHYDFLWWHRNKMILWRWRLCIEQAIGTHLMAKLCDSKSTTVCSMAVFDNNKWSPTPKVRTRYNIMW